MRGPALPMPTVAQHQGRVRCGYAQRPFAFVPCYVYYHVGWKYILAGVMH